MPLNPSERKPSAPEYFTYSDLDISFLVPGVPIWINLVLIGLAYWPQNTDEFCSVPPPTDFPTAEDLALIGNPGLGILSGGYTRLANAVKASKWAELCRWRPAPLPVEDTDPPQGFEPWIGPLTLNDAPELAFREVLWSFPEVQDQWSHLAFRVFTEGYTPDVSHVHSSNIIMAQGYDDSTGINAHTVHHDATGMPNPRGWFTLGLGVGPDRTPFPYLTASGPASPAGYFQIYVASYTPGPAALQPPILPPLPEDLVGADEDGCEDSSLPSLCRQLRALTAKVDHLIGVHGPPPMLPGPEPVDVEDEPIEKPLRAVGAIITCTSVPSIEPHYGGPPAFYPNLGHYALMTADGPLPSALIKHTPMVVANIPPSVVEIALDLTPGVTANVRWLLGPS